MQSAWLLWRRDLGIGSHIHILTRMYIKMGLFILLLAISNSLFPFPSVSSQMPNSTTFLEHDLFFCRLSHRRKSELRLCPGVYPGETLHRERSGSGLGLTTTCGCLFGFVMLNNKTTRNQLGIRFVWSQNSLGSGRRLSTSS